MILRITKFNSNLTKKKIILINYNKLKNKREEIVLIFKLAFFMSQKSDYLKDKHT